MRKPRKNKNQKTNAKPNWQPINHPVDNFPFQGPCEFSMSRVLGSPSWEEDFIQKTRCQHEGHKLCPFLFYQHVTVN